ncbi:unnamed protein product [Ectocarpus sp. CCAP 1310/34]|nr:unnamed protein product [Ectocarpus sp. CCAP 1310/34]
MEDEIPKADPSGVGAEYDGSGVGVVARSVQGTTLSGGLRPKKASNGDIQAGLADVAERLKQPEAQIADASHSRCPLASIPGIEARSKWPMERTWRRAAWPPFMARQMALSTTAFCFGVSGAVYSRRMPAASQNATKAALRDLERGLLRISQQRFAEELAAEYGVEWGKSVPLPVSVKLTDFDENEACADVPFRELVGSLMWLATQTRPDIANAVRAVARYCASPKMVHWKAALGILGYVRRTSWMGITFERGVVTGMSMQVFVDADYASKGADCRSVSGGLVMCGGGCVTWFSRTQKCVTLSTTEAEYVAFADVLKEVLFLRQVWRFMLPDTGMPCIPVFEDNQGAIQIAHNPITNSNSKHIDVRHHFIRELVERKEISITHVTSEFQHADFLTKAISKESFALHRDFA